MLHFIDHYKTRLEGGKPFGEVAMQRALHWGVVSALLSREDPAAFSTELLHRVIEMHDGETINAITARGAGSLAIGDFEWLYGTAQTPYIQFNESDLFFGLTPESQPDFIIASIRP